ncbi:hypothetical protein CYMTET_12868 [Cymbomonas tetramitiformis]|uniref:lysine--tRNA ligase n=1 Tax=Cymbomonas tetramitiformis TaxID=36881 RepID=A0AAE0LBR4_9CHLO|nr:hypothetical protein CYMTET_12868 [Cymbomonas tetramitiformis]
MWAARFGQRLAVATNTPRFPERKIFALRQPRKTVLCRKMLCTVSSAETTAKDEKPKGGKPKADNTNRRRRQRQPKGGSDAGSTLDEIRATRIEKVQTLRAAGLEPYAYRWDSTISSAGLSDKYGHLENGEECVPEGGVEAVAGRVIARRFFGKLAFLSLRDELGTTQLYIEKGTLNDKSYEEAFSHLKNLVDIGDIIGAKGTLKRTEKGELSINVTSFEMLTKSLQPLPDKFHGLTDIEKRYRQRYVDMIVNPEVREVFRSRAKITALIRRFLEDREFLEMETPVLQSNAGGADARPFCTYHNALGRDMTLRIATELHLKRMVVGGLDRVFEIGRIFRNEGISTRHNPEFTSVEVYQAYADISDMLELTETMIVRVAQELHGKLEIECQGESLDFTPPFRRESMQNLVKDVTGVDFLAFDPATGLDEARAEAVRCAALRPPCTPQ